MLNTETNLPKFTSNCINDCPFVFIARPSDPGNGNIRVVMLEINETEETQLDAGKSLLLKRGGLSFRIEPDFCAAWGELDLSPNSDDVIAIYKANHFSRLYIRIFIPSEYDYNNHTVTSDRRGGRWYDTDNPKTYLPYLYGCLNKPKRVVIFKEYTDIIALQRAKIKAERDANNYQKNKERYRKNTQARAAIKKATRLKLLTFSIK